MSQVGLLCIATNKYIKFVGPMWESAKKHFMAKHKVQLFVFTNQPDVPEGAIRVQWEHTPWPGPTLLRYHAFLTAEEQLMKMDYLYYCDADMKFVDTVGDEALGDLVGTLHPGFYNKTRYEYTYERRSQSMAYMATTEGFAYFAGGFNGGRTKNFLDMAKECKANIDIDTSRNIVAVWHDESHMNKYMFRHPPTNVLNPSYCYPESANIPFKKRLLALDKNHHDMRFGT